MKSCSRIIVLLTLLVAPSVGAAEKPPRAQPPEFSEEDRAAFFDNAFDVLVGPRPNYGAESEATATDSTGGPVTAAWSQWVDEDTLEIEIKRLARQAEDATRSAAAFKGGESRRAADALGQAAMAFAVIAQHDGAPRWRDEADRLAPHFGRAAAAAESKTDGGYRLAQAAAEDLTALVRGARPDVDDADTSVEWGALASRSSLMRRMETADEGRLPEWTVDRRTFRRNVDEVRHEAQVLALLAEAIVAPGADDADDPGYAAYARQLRDAAVRLRAAAEDTDQPAAAEAAGAIRQSCLDCHSDYRG